jgi:hypothetical protein
LYAIHVLELAKNGSLQIEDYPMLQEFKDVFPSEIPRLPPKRDLDFSIDLVSGETPISSAPYLMSTPELVELKMQLHEMLEKGNIRPSVSPWGALDVVCKEERWNPKIVY